MKKIMYLLSIVFVLSLILFTGCGNSGKGAVRKAVKNQLDQLTESNADDIRDHIHTQNLLPDQGQNQALSQDIADIYSLFYKDFSYRIKDISIKKEHASVAAKFKTLDAKALAKDFLAASLEHRIKCSVNPSAKNFSLAETYSILKNLMETKEYKTVSLDATIQLEKKDKEWNILCTPDFDSALIGNFSDYVTDSNLLSPKEIVQIHFDAIHDFNSEELTAYLGLNKLFEQQHAYQQVAEALARQVSEFFHYEILEENLDGRKATVKVAVTGIDFQDIATAYQKKAAKWLKTSEALSVGADGRREKEGEILASCIKKSKKSTSQNTEIHLVNDGVNWKIQMDSEITDAMFGEMEHILYDVSSNME